MNPPGFCPKCLKTGGTAGTRCAACAVEMLALFDSAGALSAEFLSARGTCCGSGCRNCPYPDDSASTLPTKEKVCERCGTRFQCGGPDCWCNGVKLSRESLHRLRADFADCLCQTCLSHAAGEIGR